MYPKRSSRKTLIIILIIATLGLGIGSIYTSIRLQDNQEPEDANAQTQLCNNDSSSYHECRGVTSGMTCSNANGVPGRCRFDTGTACYCNAGEGAPRCASGLNCMPYQGTLVENSSMICTTGNNEIALCCPSNRSISCSQGICRCIEVCSAGKMCGTGAGCGSGATCSESSACNQECELSNGVRTGYMFACRGNSVQRIQATQTCPPPQVNSNTDTNNNTGNNSNNTNNNTDNTTTNNNTNTQTDSVITNTNTSVTNTTTTTNSNSNLPVTSIHDNLPYYYIIGALTLFGGIIFVFRKKI